MIKKELKKWQFGDFSIKFWDNEEISIGKNPPKFSIIFKRKISHREIHKDMSLTFGELYMRGGVEIVGDYDALMRVLHRHTNAKVLQQHNHKISHIHTHKERQNIKSHYDIGNDFYRLWLDETMSYSCAYFKNPDDSLYQAQINKIDHTLKKLDLQKGERLLDIGCGWGWLAIKAAQEYGVNVVGITISQEQYAEATHRVKSLGLQEQVEIRLQNYQDLPLENCFDKIVSVGMFEHVGKKNIPLYFSCVKHLLKPGGKFLLHSIMSYFEGKTNRWIDKYIFPGGYLPTLGEVMKIASESGFNLLLSESLRIHYAKTLDLWHENFQKVKAEVRLMYDEEFVRMWELYLKTCASAFRVGNIDLMQFLFTKDAITNVPTTYAYIYS